MVLWIRVCRSFHPSFHLSGCFLGIVSLVFSKFWHDARNPYEVEPDFPENIFLPQKSGKWAKNGSKTGFFFNILKDFVNNFYWICSIMKIYIICCVPAQIPNWEKFWFLRYGIWAKMFSVNQIAGFFNQPYLQNKSME